MKLATFNVNSLKTRLPIVIDWLAAHQPDVLMLQELKGLEQPVAELNAAGYHVQMVTQKAYNGVAILTREPSTVIHTKLTGDDTDAQARYIEVDYKGLRVINIYSPNGNPLGTEKFTYKLNWLKRLHDHLAILRQQRLNVVIAGDFNIIPEDIDAAHPQDWANDALFQPESRSVYRGLLALGYTDAFRALHGTAAEYSFWDYQAGAWPRNNGIRIDHFLLSPGVADHLTACGIDRTPRALEKPSDHTPVWVEIDL